MNRRFIDLAWIAANTPITLEVVGTYKKIAEVLLDSDPKAYQSDKKALTTLSQLLKGYQVVRAAECMQTYQQENADNRGLNRALTATAEHAPTYFDRVLGVLELYKEEHRRITYVAAEVVKTDIPLRTFLRVFENNAEHPKMNVLIYFLAQTLNEVPAKALYVGDVGNFWEEFKDDGDLENLLKPLPQLDSRVESYQELLRNHKPSALLIAAALREALSPHYLLGVLHRWEAEEDVVQVLEAAQEFGQDLDSIRMLNIMRDCAGSPMLYRVTQILKNYFSKVGHEQQGDLMKVLEAYTREKKGVVVLDILEDVLKSKDFQALPILAGRIFEQLYQAFKGTPYFEDILDAILGVGQGGASVDWANPALLGDFAERIYCNLSTENKDVFTIQEVKTVVKTAKMVDGMYAQDSQGLQGAVKKEFAAMLDGKMSDGKTPQQKRRIVQEWCYNIQHTVKEKPHRFFCEVSL